MSGGRGPRGKRCEDLDGELLGGDGKVVLVFVFEDLEELVEVERGGVKEVLDEVEFPFVEGREGENIGLFWGWKGQDYVHYLES